MAGKRIVIPNYMPALDLNGNPLAGAKITFYENETTTLASVYANEALTTPLANPVVANLAGVFPSIFADEDLVFTVAITDADDNPIGGLRNKDEVRPSQIFGADSAAAENAASAAEAFVAEALAIQASGDDAAAIAARAAKNANLSDLTDAAAARANIGADLAANVNFTPAGTGAVVRTAQDKARERVSVKDFDAVGDGVADDTAAIQAAINYGMSSGAAVYAPVGTYKITSTISITDDVVFYGDGSARTNFNMVSASVVPAFLIACPDNFSIVGLEIGGFSITCNGGAARCDGIKITTTATNSALSVCDFHHIRILQARRGVWAEGVIYMNKFRNITCVFMYEYGWYLPGPAEFIYNSFTNLEVTGTENGAYSYYSNASAAQWETITADGCCYFAGAYTTVNGISVEGIHATTTASNSVIEVNQIKEISNVAIINVPNAKCGIGITANDNVNILGVRFPDSGAGNQPNRPVLFAGGSTGLMTTVQMENCVSRLSPTDLGGVLAIGCEDVTDAGFAYTGPGTWSPDFSDWNTPPSVASAKYTVIGRVVHLFISASDGFAAEYDTVGGLPFPASADVGGTATFVPATSSKGGTGRIASGTSVISGLKQMDLTAGPEFWQMHGTYLI